jgi:hypothetical protein
MAFLPASEKKSIANSLISIEACSVGLVTASTRAGSSVWKRSPLERAPKYSLCLRAARKALAAFCGPV